MNSARLRLSALRSGRSCRPSTARGCSIFSSGCPFSARSCAICSSGVQKHLSPALSRRSCSSLATHSGTLSSCSLSCSFICPSGSLPVPVADRRDDLPQQSGSNTLALMRTVDDVVPPRHRIGGTPVEVPGVPPNAEIPGTSSPPAVLDVELAEDLLIPLHVGEYFGVDNGRLVPDRDAYAVMMLFLGTVRVIDQVVQPDDMRRQGAAELDVLPAARRVTLINVSAAISYHGTNLSQGSLAASSLSASALDSSSISGSPVFHRRMSSSSVCFSNASSSPTLSPNSANPSRSMVMLSSFTLPGSSSRRVS